MNFSQVNLSICQVAQTFLNRFQVLPQHCPCALKLGFTHIVRFVSYDPRTPFVFSREGFPLDQKTKPNDIVKFRLNMQLIASQSSLRKNESDLQV